MKWFVLFLAGCVQPACAFEEPGFPAVPVVENSAADTVPVPSPALSGKTVATRFPVPEGYVRVPTDTPSFPHFLRQLPLHPDGYPVHLYNGGLKYRQDTHAAVLDFDTGRSDLQQCADAVIRLRAEYLYHQKRYDDIHFRFTSGFVAEYARWRRGERIRVEGNRCSWVPGGRATDAYPEFRRYLDMVFMYAGTASLEKELELADPATMQGGELWIVGGHPGHAVLVVDVARHPKTGERCFLLAQSYMPAQEIHVLKNPRHESPWYFTSELEQQLETPEWVFKKGQFRRFPDGL